MPANDLATKTAGPRVLVQLRDVDGLEDLRRQVDRWEACGVAGVVVTDHLFVGGDSDQVRRPPDPFVLLGAVAALSPGLVLGTMVANIGLQHPALVFRHAAQLAALVGGERVLAGIGAGWNPEEFEALGEQMPAFAERTDRLEEAARLGRALFDDGRATIDGRHVTARRLPLAPMPSSPPRLMLGGGSDRVLQIAGRYADHLDLNGSPRSSRIGRRAAVAQDGVRRLTTTREDLRRSVETVRQVAAEAGRPASAVTFSVFVDVVDVCPAERVDEVLADLCRARGVPPRDLTDCPYVLAGPLERIAESVERTVDALDVSTLIVRDGPHLEQLCTALRGSVA
jgi:alkanesulfonate monooxygenase SsuD/methylene tetrahydromethanopterin reductase-like flavin-dependent oxidoreductase (luciferase family)